jgi:hypothetical protein
MTDHVHSLPHLDEVFPLLHYDHAGVGRPRPVTIHDSLYGRIKLSAWATALISTPPFRRLAGVSLSSVPGELLFGHTFPSRLDHSVGVYHLTRVARPRDRALQLAALAHDLGHGPFSHLTERLMLEWLGQDHESRSIVLLERVRAALPESTLQRMAWLDWEEVARLMRGEGRGTLLNGNLDYDNIDNVARFKQQSGFGVPAYSPTSLARGLRYASQNVTLQWEVEPEGLAWQTDRATVYGFLHGDDGTEAGGPGGHRNLAVHAMLRKAVDLAYTTHILPPDFFDLTDAEALSVLGSGLTRGLLALVQRIKGEHDQWHRCIWEAVSRPDDQRLPARLSTAGERLRLEADLAAEAGLSPHEVILDSLVSSAGRALPPFTPGAPGVSSTLPSGGLAAAEPLLPSRVTHLFIASGYGSDYARRLSLAAERRFGGHEIRTGAPQGGAPALNGRSESPAP